MDPCTLEEIFTDYKERRAAILHALVVDFDDFYKQCDPKRVELYLYAYSDGNWKLTDSPDDVDGLPLPPRGHNKIRDDLSTREWANNICIRSQAWLIAVAFYFAGKHDIQQAGREELFKLVNALPTLKQEIAWVVIPAGVDSSSSSSTDSEKVASYSNVEDFCPVCDKGERKKRPFWIFCDQCKRWNHGKCVVMTPEKAEKIDIYKCPSCESENALKLTWKFDEKGENM